MINRRNIALDLLKNYTTDELFFLGEGMTSVVYHTTERVYKVYFLDSFEALSYKTQMLGDLKSKIKLFDNSSFFYPIEEFIKINDKRFVLVYPYEISEKCKSFQEDEIQDFLVECWQKRIIFQDLKPENFIRVNQQLKWIDYEPDKFTDNLFLNMAVRAFIYVKFANSSTLYLKKLCRSAINNFDIKELEGVRDFINRVYAKIIYSESCLKSEIKKINFNCFDTIEEAVLESSKFSLKYSKLINPEKIRFDLISKGYNLESIASSNIRLTKDNYFTPETVELSVKKLVPPKHKTSLIIKACTQDSEVVFEAVKHIVSQLSSPNIFDEKIIALDIKTKDFLREYNSKGKWEILIDEVTQLKEQGIIDKIVFPSEDDIAKINKKYFNINTTISHTFKGVPIAAQLYAFEQARNNYILQLDCDVMIGRLNHNHSYLNDMMNEIDNNAKVISVGFNIYKGLNSSFTKYFGFENGGFVPEVRFCLLNKERLQALLPLENEIYKEGLKFSWYRSLERKQKETNYCSVRGGHSDSFFVHIPNFKKQSKDVWFTKLDRVEQLQLPESQVNQFDLIDSYYDWTNPSRNEELVVVSCLRNIELSRFLRFWHSLVSQSYKEWGLIIIDDSSENGLSYYIKELIKPYSDRVTFIDNKFRVGVAVNTYKAIHYFMKNEESVVVILDADDALIGRNALKNLFEKYSWNKADVVIGKMYRTDKLSAHYSYQPNFVNPRLYGGNVWQHLRSFKKYLFDSLDFEDLKIRNSLDLPDDILLSKRFSQKMKFPEHCWDYTYMIPIVEMSSNPIWINHYNVFHDRTTINTPEIRDRKDMIIAEILSKKTKSPEDVVIGRKRFLPNLNKIEIDITYECNLKCLNCNRSSTQAPIKEGMKFKDIERFVLESIELNKKWELINILGGEPTLHDDFGDIICEILYKYIIPFSPNTILQITSNGFGDLVKGKLDELPKHENVVIDYASFKDDRKVPYFSPFNEAPLDEESSNQDRDYSKGCWVTSYCGIGLNQLGYYPCGVAGGIDRVFQKNIGVKNLKDVDKSINKLLNEFCKYCGNFSDYAVNKGNFIPRNEKAVVLKPSISKTWKEKYKIYNAKK